MVSDLLSQHSSSLDGRVLILVLMEYGLWRIDALLCGCIYLCLNPCSNGIWSLTGGGAFSDATGGVLILVLMEYGLWRRDSACASGSVCLNPCSNGIWSLTKECSLRTSGVVCLNPCSNGIWSLTLLVWPLIFVSGCLNPCSNGIWSLTWGYFFLPILVRLS